MFERREEGFFFLMDSGKRGLDGCVWSFWKVGEVGEM